MEGVLKKVKPVESALVVGSQKSLARSFVTGDISAVEKLRSRFYSLISKNPTHPEACLGAISFLEGMVQVVAEDNTAYKRPNCDSLKDTLTILGAEQSIVNASCELYNYCRRYLLSILSAQSSSNFPTIPTALVLEEVYSIIQWLSERLHSLSINSSVFKLGDEGFFGIKIDHDIERNGIYGILVSGGINLDSRGNDDLWLSLEMQTAGQNLYSGKDRPLGTRGERKIGKIIIDRFEHFIDYYSIKWPNQVEGKIANANFVLSVINRQGEALFSFKTVETCRILRKPDNLSQKTYNDWSDSMLKGNRLDNTTVNRSETSLQVSTDCTVIGQVDKNVTLAFRFMDQEQNQIELLEYELLCLTNIARFYEVGVLIEDHKLVKKINGVEITIFNEQQKIMFSRLVNC